MQGMLFGLVGRKGAVYCLAMNTESPSSFRSFRFVCAPDELAPAMELLQLQGYSFVPEPFHPLVFRLVAEPRPLGTSLAARFGLIYIQDRSSMLPPLVLAPPAGARVLDICASPGSKTGFLAQFVGDTGFVLGNEPSRSRLATLRRNLQTMNLLQCATASYPGEDLPSHAPPNPQGNAGWPFILLDPPCSGWGTVEKNPDVMQLWQGEKVLPLIALQRKLLRRAAALLAPGGALVYSTCTTNVAENEEQVRFALDELGLEPVPIAQPPGFSFAEPLPGFAGCLRVNLPGSRAALAEGTPENEDGGGQGFFVALFSKKGQATETLPQPCPYPQVPLSALAASPFVDTSRLPPGDVVAINGNVRFLPSLWRESIPEGFQWKGFSLGKVQGEKQGHGFPCSQVRVLPGLRRLMPSVEKARREGLPLLHVDDTASISQLLGGQSVTIDGNGKEAGLYFRGLPLCRLILKGKRAILPQM